LSLILGRSPVYGVGRVIDNAPVTGGSLDVCATTWCFIISKSVSLAVVLNVALVAEDSKPRGTAFGPLRLIQVILSGNDFYSTSIDTTRFALFLTILHQALRI
jgi:hypothetical protein